MKLRNVSSNPIMINVKGKGVVVEPNGEIVLFDEDVEQDKGILSLISQGLLSKVSGEEPYEQITGVDTDVSAQVVKWVRAGDTHCSFVNYTVGKGRISSVEVESGDPTTMYVGITNTNEVVDIFADDVTVTLSPSTGITVSPTSGKVSDGVLRVTVTATQSGTITVTNDKGLTNVNLTVTVSS